MEAQILNANFDCLAILDSFESFIWTDRYDAYGDFELFTPTSNDTISYLKEGYYLECRDSDRLMIIEHFIINTDIEDGNTIKTIGRSLESILCRRIVWNQTVLKGNLQNAIFQLLDENIIFPTIKSRQIDNFICKASSDPKITELVIDAQYNGENLYDVIQGICSAFSIGFKIVLNENNHFVFQLYAGVDRSYNQETNPYVMFCPNFDNILNSTYVESHETKRNVALVAGAGEGTARKQTIVGDVSGLNRREIYVNASDVATEIDGAPIPEEEYIKQIAQKGTDALLLNQAVQTFEGQIDTTQMYRYGQDFQLGDIVQLQNEYGMESRSRISEIIVSHDTSGIDIVPTFIAVS